MSNYTTGEIAKLCGVSVRTVQYYDTRGILIPDQLTEGGRRLYSENDLSKMKVICFLRELDMSLETIAKLMREENSGEVISLILEEQEYLLRAEADEKQKKLEKLASVRALLKKSEAVSVESIGDIARVMENKKQMKKLHAVLILSGIPLGILQWSSIILWIMSGIWWLFAVWALVAVPYAVVISRYYFKRVVYICPRCHKIFKPSMKEVFFANHTPNTRKLTCPDCGYRGFCVETYRTEKISDNTDTAK